jgi:hypothetical protein
VICVVKVPLRSSSTDSRVPRLGLNCGNDKLDDQSVKVEEIGVVVFKGPSVAA